MKNEDIYKALRVSKELLELVDSSNLIISEKNYKALMKQLGFTDSEINNMIQETDKSTNVNYIVPNKTYKHINYDDLAFHVLSVGFTDEELICRIVWMDIINPKKFEVQLIVEGYNLYRINIETIYIKSDDIQNWKEITEDKS
jgi:hypothetical protein